MVEVDEFAAGLENGEGSEEDEADEEGKGQAMDGSFVVVDGEARDNGNQEKQDVEEVVKSAVGGKRFLLD